MKAILEKCSTSGTISTNQLEFTELVTTQEQRDIEDLRKIVQSLAYRCDKLDNLNQQLTQRLSEAESKIVKNKFDARSKIGDLKKSQEKSDEVLCEVREAHNRLAYNFFSVHHPQYRNFQAFKRT